MILVYLHKRDRALFSYFISMKTNVSYILTNALKIQTNMFMSNEMIREHIDYLLGIRCNARFIYRDSINFIC